MNIKKIVLLALIAVIPAVFFSFLPSKNSMIPLVAIANFGPHSSLDASIAGIKDELARNGYIENKTIRYEVVDVGFNAALIPQMIANIKSHSPKVFVAITTPVAQYAKGMIKDIPLIYSVITDPVASGLIQQENHSEDNLTGSSDKQNFSLLFDFVKRVLKNPKRVGVLYSTSESNDVALLNMIKQASLPEKIQVMSVAVEEARDVAVAMQKFKNKVDFIYVGASGAIQPSLPVIAAASRNMGIPVFNVNDDAVKENMVLASFGVNYRQVGVNTGKLVYSVLQGKSISSLTPTYPSLADHQGFISQKNADLMGIKLPTNLNNTKILG
ncbi:MAG: ABC transporter substrate-binding protein [Legionellaceae bacterium]|nr:ABC transporter substrate-binding protein [Legionellaceae bacterium]